MDILFLSSWYPEPPSNGSKLRILHLLRRLAQQHTVTLITMASPTDTPGTAELAALCKAVKVVPRREYQPTSRRAMLGLLSPTPRSIIDTRSFAIAEVVRSTVERGTYDVVIASELQMAAYWDAFRHVPAIFEDLEVGIFETKLVSANLPMQRLRHYLTLWKLGSYLRRLLPRFGACTVVSQVERDLVRRFAPSYGAVETIPNAIDLSEYPKPLYTSQLLRPNSLIFTGSLSYSVNHQAMVWFIREVLPLIRRSVPGAQLFITGDHANLPLPSSDGITLTGMVDDVRPLISSSVASVVPIWMGSGTRLKILEAMALCTPVIATSKGAEGLDVEHEHDILIADTPEEFAQATVRLLTQPDLRERITENGYQLVSNHYDWTSVMPQFLRLVDRVALGGVTNGR